MKATKATKATKRARPPASPGASAAETALDGRTARAHRTRAAIVEALLQLLQEGRFRPTAQQVADRAGVALRSIRQHFASRDALFLAVADRIATTVGRDAAPIDPAAPLRARVEAFVGARAHYLEATAVVRRASLAQESGSPSIAKAFRFLARTRGEELGRLFARELAALGPERERSLSALAVVSGGRVWDGLRGELGLSRAAAAAVLRRLLEATLSAK